MSPSPEDLGPLPQSDRQDTLQQKSLRALRNLLPEDLFLIRDERVDDKGVDLALEVKVPSEPSGNASSAKALFTNCRAQCQMKSTDDASELADGSITCSVATSNLNYLLNGTSPLYFFWIEPAGQMRFAWARDEWQRLDTENPSWKEQRTVALRLRHVLTADTTKDVHARILNESLATRRILETVARSANAERVVTTIDRKTLDSTDPAELYKWLNDSGLTIVSAGYGNQVIARSHLLNQNNRTEPRVQLVIGYAFASLGRNMEALGHLSAATLRRATLSASDQQVLDHLRDACEYHTGRIDFREFTRRATAWVERQTGANAIEIQIDLLRAERMRERSKARRAELLAQLRANGADLEAAADSTPSRAIFAKLIALEAEGDDLYLRYIEYVTVADMKRSAGALTPKAAEDLFRPLQGDWQAWLARSAELVLAAAHDGHPILLADAFAIRVRAVCMQLLVCQRQAVGTGHGWQPDRDMVSSLVNEADRAKTIYSVAGQIDGETRMNLVLADLRSMLGQSQEAAALASEVWNTSDAMHYGGYKSRAEDHLRGNVGIPALAHSWKSFQENADFHIAAKSDEELREVADAMRTALNHRASHLLVFERECQLDRRMAQERITFCQHLQISPSPMRPIDFARLPPRTCRCARHQHSSQIADPDVSTVITAFKGAYCSACPDQKPKQRTSS